MFFLTEDWSHKLFIVGKRDQEEFSVRKIGFIMQVRQMTQDSMFDFNGVQMPFMNWKDGEVVPTTEFKLNLTIRNLLVFEFK